MHYEILEKLGEGGMADVFLAYDNQMKSHVAIKKLKKEFVHSPNVKGRFIAEARSMFSMNHVNVVKVFSLIELDDFIGAVMEYVPGITLNDFIRNKGIPKNEDIKKLMTQMADALDYVHGVSMIHRDVKPSNFMVNDQLEIKLLDFGIAKNQNSQYYDYTATSTTQQMGTPLYMSPEQIKTPNQITQLTDIYSLGVVLFFIVTGKSPYDENSTSLFDLQIKIVQENLPSTNTSWDKIIKKATMKDPADRYQSARELGIEIKNIDLNATIVNSPPIDKTVVIQPGNRTITDSKTKNFNKKKKYLILVVISLILIIGSVIGVSMIETEEEKIAAAESIVTTFSKDLDLNSRNEQIYPGIKKMGALYYLKEFKITNTEVNEDGTLTVYGSYNRIGNMQNVKFTVEKKNGKYCIKESRGVSGYYDSPLMTYCINKGYLNNFNDMSDKQLDKVCQDQEFYFKFLVDKVANSLSDKVHMDKRSSDVKIPYGMYVTGHVTIVNESNIDLPMGSVRYMLKFVDKNFNEIYSENLNVNSYLPAGGRVKEDVFISNPPSSGNRYLVIAEVTNKYFIENAVARDPNSFE